LDFTAGCLLENVGLSQIYSSLILDIQFTKYKNVALKKAENKSSF